MKICTVRVSRPQHITNDRVHKKQSSKYIGEKEVDWLRSKREENPESLHASSIPLSSLESLLPSTLGGTVGNETSLIALLYLSVYQNMEMNRTCSIHHPSNLHPASFALF